VLVPSGDQGKGGEGGDRDQGEGRGEADGGGEGAFAANDDVGKVATIIQQSY